jgi:hypothetical protein
MPDIMSVGTADFSEQQEKKTHDIPKANTSDFGKI